MQTTLSLRDILLARVPCSSSSFLSVKSRTARNQIFATKETDVVPLSDSYRQLLDTESHEGEDVVPGNFRKRRRKSSQVVCQLKKQTVESELLKVSRELWLLVGRLLLWNKSLSAHPQACSNTLDCLALTDGATTLCCTITDVDPQLLGQLVQVTSWTFVPWPSHPIVEAGVPLEFLGNTGSAKSARDLIWEGHVIGSESLASPSCGGGVLEIRSLKLLAEASAPSVQVSVSGDLDSVPCQNNNDISFCSQSTLGNMYPFLHLILKAAGCSPATADIRNQVLESPSLKTGPSKPRLRLWGSVQCISPPFVLPSKRSQRNLPTPLAGATTACNGPQKSLFRDETGTRVQSEGQSMLGFLLELQTCSHTPHCNNFCVANKVEQQPLIMSTSEEAGSSSKEEASRVYFTGSVAAWRSVLGGMLGECVVITGLRSKMICVGPERKEYSVFVATRTSLVFHLGSPEFSVTSEKEGKLQCSKYNLYKERLISCPREGDTLGRTRLEGLRDQTGAKVALCGEAACQRGTGFGSYVGTVTDIMMQGQLVQLDKQVWLLMTHYNLTYVHGLRVGAMVAVRHAHIIALKSPSEKGLLLGACFRSHVHVVLYSALNTEVSEDVSRRPVDIVNTYSQMIVHNVCRTRPVTAQASQSRLKKCIEGLPLTSAFWLLQITATLRCKLKGVHTDEELLGSNKDAFKEFFLHNPFCHLGDTTPATSTLKVPPISNFCEHVETLWLDQGSLVWQREDKKKATSISQRLKSDLDMPRNENRTNYVRHIISSTELGVVLIGALKVCQLSGKLQLADATGALNAVVPDLQSFSNLHCMYQISEFKVVLEGEHNSFSDYKSVKRDRTLDFPISWSNLLRGVVLTKKPSKLVTYYVYFHLRHANCYQGLSWPTGVLNTQIQSSVLNKCQEMQRSETFWNGRQFDIVMITHKHPVTVKEREPSQWTFYSEAILLPWCLSIQKENWDKEHRSCTMDCTVCCLPPQSSVDRKSLVFAAALKRRRCLGRSGDLNTCCLTLEGQRETQTVERLEKLLLEFNWRSIEYSQVINVGQCYLLPILHREVSTSNSFNFSTTKRISVGTSLPVLSLDWEFLRDCQLSHANEVATSYETPSPTRSGCDSKEYVEIRGFHHRTKIQNPSGYGKYLNRLQFCNSAFPSLEWKRGSTRTPKAIPSLRSKFKMGSSNGGTENLKQDTVNPKNKVPQLVDTVIVVSKTSKEYLKHFLAEIRAHLFIPLLGVRETLEYASHPAEKSPDKSTIAGILDSRSNAGSEETMDGIFSLQGPLVSVWGKVESIEVKSSQLMGRTQHKQPCSGPSPELGKEHPMMILKIQDLHGDQILKVQLNFDKYVCPIGLGPGAVVCLLRILLQSGSSIQLQGIPTTLIMIHEVEERLPLQSQGSEVLNIGSPSVLLLEFDDDPDGLNRLDLLSDLIFKSEPTNDCLRVHCKVVAVQMLELEWQGNQVVRSAGRKLNTLPHSVEDIVKNVSITTASFLLDDGSAVAECWASYKQAADLLGFPELIGQAPILSNVFCNLVHKLLWLLKRQSAGRVSLDQVLSLLVQKHGRIIVLGEPTQGDTGSTSWLIRAANGDHLQAEEALVLRVIMQRACQMVSKVVQCQVLSAEQRIANSARELQQEQYWMTAAETNNNQPWQTLTWSRTQLVARKVECTNNWRELERLARDF